MVLQYGIGLFLLTECSRSFVVRCFWVVKGLLIWTSRMQTNNFLFLWIKMLKFTVNWKPYWFNKCQISWYRELSMKLQEMDPMQGWHFLWKAHRSMQGYLQCSATHTFRLSKFAYIHTPVRKHFLKLHDFPRVYANAHIFMLLWWFNMMQRSFGSFHSCEDSFKRTDVWGVWMENKILFDFVVGNWEYIAESVVSCLFSNHALYVGWDLMYLYFWRMYMRNYHTEFELERLRTEEWILFVDKKYQMKNQHYFQSFARYFWRWRT